VRGLVSGTQAKTEKASFFIDDPLHLYTFWRKSPFFDVLLCLRKVLPLEMILNPYTSS